MCAIKSPNEFNSLVEVAVYFNDEMICLKYLEQWLHNGSIRCPHCGFQKICRFKDGKRFHCYNCKIQFTAKIGTIFQSSQIPLQKWFMAMYLISAHKRGIASSQLAKDIGVTRKTAWFMAHRIRSIVKQDDIELEGVVQSDETFVGGKNGNRHIDKKTVYARNKGREFTDKATVIGLLDSNGKAKTAVIPSPNFKYIKPVIMSTIKSGSTWVTDNYFSIRTLAKHFKREVVNHHKRQFQSKNGYSTNGIENFWSHLKRMIIGTYYRVSRKHLQLYCNEQTFRFNTKDMGNGERFALLFTKVNCRISYKQLIKG